MRRSVVSIFASIMVWAAVVQPAAAASKPKIQASTACWQRIYTQAELKRHRRQKVSMVLLTLDTGEDGSVSASLGLNLRKRTSDWKYDYSSGGLCKPHGDTYTCAPDWDAGSFELEKGARGGLRVKNHKLVANPYNYDSEDVSEKAVNFRKSDDAIWLLFPADPAKCRLP